MNRHLIWIIAGTSVLGLGVPALAAARSDGTPDDNGVPGDVRGNCDEVEHANDPGCITVLAPSPTTGSIVVTVPSTSPSTIPINTTPSNTTPSNTTPSNTTPSNTNPGNAIPSNTAPSNTAPGNTAPGNTMPGTSVANGSPVDVSGPCDEPEHAADPRCTGTGAVDDSGHRSDDGVGHDQDDDRSGRRGGDDDDRSGRRGGGDDRSGHSGSDDDGARSGHGGGDD